jgi:hypothetical protein
MAAAKKALQRVSASHKGFVYGLGCPGLITLKLSFAVLLLSWLLLKTNNSHCA